MNKMKTAVIVTMLVSFIAAVAAGVWYYKTKFYIPDKDGMVYSDSDTDNQGDD